MSSILPTDTGVPFCFPMEPFVQPRNTETPNDVAPFAEEQENPARAGREWIISLLAKANEATRAGNLQDLFTQFLDLMLELTGAESTILYLYDSGTDELVFTTVRGDEESQGLVGLRLKKNLWLLDTQTSQSEMIIVGDLVNDPALLRIVNPAKVSSLHNMIVIPLLLEGKIFGVIQIFNYARCELDLMKTFVNRFVTEADRLMTLEMTLHSNQRLKLLIDMIGQVSGKLDRSQLMQMVPEQAARLTEAERSSLFLVDGSTNELGFHASFQLPEERIREKAASDRQNQLQKILANVKAARAVPSHPASPGHKLPNEFGFATRSAITVPLHETTLAPEERQSHTRATVGGLTVLKKRGEAFDEEDVQLLETLAHQASIFLHAAELYENVNDLFLDVIKALVAAIDAKDRSTQGHSMRVQEYALAIAERVGLDTSTISDIRISSLLHDVGKIGVSDHILVKPGRLTAEEYKSMKKHPLYGRQILSQVRVLQSALPGISEHHERLDGSGYPYGLCGDQISIAGRVIAVADVFDAMTTDRPYRKAISRQAAIQYLIKQSGKLFDRDYVQAIQQIVEQGTDSLEGSVPIEKNGDSGRPSPFP